MGRNWRADSPKCSRTTTGFTSSPARSSRRSSPAQWTGRTRTPAGVELTTWKWLRAMLEHEAHHRGQLYLTLGLLGVATPPIYGLSEPELLAQSVP